MTINKIHQYIVDQEWNNTRIDHYLTAQLNTTKSQINKLIACKQIFINNILVTKNGHKIYCNDDVKIDVIDKTINNKNNTTINWTENHFPIIYEDDHYLVIDKPANVLVYDNKFHEQYTIANYLKFKYPSSDFLDQDRYGIVHRLDKDTTGLLLIAKNQNSYEQLINLFIKKQIIKKYICLVHNCFSTQWQTFKIETLIGRNKHNIYKMQVDNAKDAKHAVTYVQVLKNIGHNYALVECNLVTGRTHQARVHMSYINHPILNDPLYSNNKTCSNYGQYLYCAHLEFIDPFTLQNKKITLELPTEFLDKIEILENE